jgi:hypothetical protein
MVTPKAPIPRKRLIIAAGLAAFLLVSGATYYVYSSRSNTPPKLSQAPSLKQAHNGSANNPSTSTQGSGATQVTVTPTTDPYQGWKTEQTSKKYTIKYPHDWFNEQEVSASVSNDEAFLTNEKVKYPGQISANGIFATISVRPISNMSDDIDSVMFNSPVGQVKLSGLGESNQVFTKVADLKIEGNPAVYYTNDSSATVKNAPNYDEVYVVKKNNQYIRIDFFMNKDLESRFHDNVQKILNSLHLEN